MLGPSLQKYLLKHRANETMNSKEHAASLHEPEVQPADPMHVQQANHQGEPVPPETAEKWSRYVAR